MQIQGKLIEKFDTVNVTDSFRKREFVVEYAENPQYPELLKFELIQEKCDLLDPYQKGDKVEVYFNLKGRKWTDPKGVDKYFNSLQAWRLEKTKDEGENISFGEQSGAENMKEPEWLGNDSEEEDELPF